MHDEDTLFLSLKGQQLVARGPKLARLDIWPAGWIRKNEFELFTKYHKNVLSL